MINIKILRRTKFLQKKGKWLARDKPKPVVLNLYTFGREFFEHEIICEIQRCDYK